MGLKPLEDPFNTILDQIGRQAGEQEVRLTGEEIQNKGRLEFERFRHKKAREAAEHRIKLAQAEEAKNQQRREAGEQAEAKKPGPGTALTPFERDASTPEATASGAGAAGASQLADVISQTASGGGVVRRGLTPQESQGLSPDQAAQAVVTEGPTGQRRFTGEAGVVAGGLDLLKQFNFFALNKALEPFGKSVKDPTGGPLNQIRSKSISIPNQQEIALNNAQQKRVEAAEQASVASKRKTEIDTGINILNAMDTTSLTPEQRVGVTREIVEGYNSGDLVGVMTSMQRVGMKSDRMMNLNATKMQAETALANSRLAGQNLSNEQDELAAVRKQDLAAIGIATPPDGHPTSDQLTQRIGALTFGADGEVDATSMAQLPALTNAFYSNTATHPLNGHILIVGHKPLGGLAGTARAVFVGAENQNIYAVPVQTGVRLLKDIRAADDAGRGAEVSKLISDASNLFPGLGFAKKGGVYQFDAKDVSGLGASPKFVGLSQSYNIMSNVADLTLGIEQRQNTDLKPVLEQAPEPTRPDALAPRPAPKPQPRRPARDSGTGTVIFDILSEELGKLNEKELETLRSQGFK